MLPVIVLVGRPNVGKSTLFNRITRTQNALVADFPGLTRDRQYGEARFDQKSFLVVDTGGIGVDDIAVDDLMSKQSALALIEADLIFFLVDAQSGLTPLDQSIAGELRKQNKPIYLIVNKTDGIDSVQVCSDFQSLGFSRLYAISASHGRGVQSLLTETTSHFLPEEPIEVEDEQANAIKITFVGRPNVGKSTLVNRLLGEERVVVYDMPGTTRDSIAIPFERDGQSYTLIDTAGVRRRGRIHEKIEKFSVIKTLQSIEKAHVCLMMIDAKEGITDQDLHLMGFILQAGKAMVVAVNKWDGLEASHREQVKQALERRFQFAPFAAIHFISALHGSGVGHLFSDIRQAYQSAIKTFSTPQLTRLLEDLVSQHTPPLVNGRRIKLRYAHSGGHNPPIIVIHGNQLNNLPDSYKRYLMKGFIQHLELVGTPLKLEFKQAENPFKGKKNALTERQAKRRKRLMTHVKKK